jgi:hypothetical protein
MKPDVRKFLSEIGSKGGKAAKGKAKVRGDSAYYRRLRKMGVKKQTRKTK